MTTPQWTVDDGQELGYRSDGLTWWFDPYDLYMAWGQPGPDHGLATEAHAALVADVAAARLVDDMAAVVRRYEDHWRPSLRRPGWWECDRPRPSPVRDLLRMTPGEVAALHHARQQERT